MEAAYITGVGALLFGFAFLILSTKRYRITNVVVGLIFLASGILSFVTRPLLPDYICHVRIAVQLATGGAAAVLFVRAIIDSQSGKY